MEYGPIGASLGAPNRNEIKSASFQAPTVKISGPRDSEAADLCRGWDSGATIRCAGWNKTENPLDFTDAGAETARHLHALPNPKTSRQPAQNGPDFNLHAKPSSESINPGLPNGATRPDFCLKSVPEHQPQQQYRKNAKCDTKNELFTAKRANSRVSHGQLGQKPT